MAKFSSLLANSIVHNVITFSNYKNEIWVQVGSRNNWTNLKILDLGQEVLAFDIWKDKF